MNKDFDDDDLEELDDDDSDDFEDYDDDDLEELEADDSPFSAETAPPTAEDGWEEPEEEDDDVPVVAEVVAPVAEEDFDELVEEEATGEFVFEGEESRPPAAIETEEDQDASFFDEVVEEEDDLGLGPVGQPMKAATEEPPPVGLVVDTVIREFSKPEAKGLQPVFLALPAVGILLGVGYYFLKGGENIPLPAPPAVKQESVRGKFSPGYEKKPSFIKPKIDNTIPADYEELKKVELVDNAKIDSLVKAGLLKKKMNTSSLSIEKIVLTLYKTTVRYVVSQTYHYSDGTKWTVETHFSEHESEREDVIKAFNSVYAG